MFLCTLPNSKFIKFRLWGIRIKQCGSIWIWYWRTCYTVTLSTALCCFVSAFDSSLLLLRLSVAIEFGRLSSTSTCTVCCSVLAVRRLSSSSSTCSGCSVSVCLSSSPTWTCMACWRCCVSATKVGCLSSTCIACGVSAVEVGRLVFWSNISTLFKPLRFFKNRPLLLHLIHAADAACLWN